MKILFATVLAMALAGPAMANDPVADQKAGSPGPTAVQPRAAPAVSGSPSLRTEGRGQGQDQSEHDSGDKGAGGGAGGAAGAGGGGGAGGAGGGGKEK